MMSFANSFAKDNDYQNNPDSLKQYLMVEFSLFNEYHKNKDFESAYSHGWNVINSDPTMLLRYKPFKKMEDVLWFLHDSVATYSDEEKLALADTTLAMYQKAIQYVPDKKGYYLAKSAYVIEMWKEASPEEKIQAYEAAFIADPELSVGYYDRLGIIFASNASEENDYKIRALELYSKLSEKEPDNALWIQRMESLAEDMAELVELTGKAWEMDKENPEKAWKYASMALRAQEYETAIIPLEFLISKSPDVVNYQKQIADAYRKTEQTDKAIASYKTLIELEPENRDNYYNLAIIYQRQDQLSVARSYLYKASKASPEWDMPVFLEAQLYEQAARNCGFEFMDRIVYQLAVDTYRKAARLGGANAGAANDRVGALSSSVPQSEDYFFRKLKPGDTVKIEGQCYGWIGKSITVPKN